MKPTKATFFKEGATPQSKFETCSSYTGCNTNCIPDSDELAVSCWLTGGNLAVGFIHSSSIKILSSKTGEVEFELTSPNQTPARSFLQLKNGLLISGHTDGTINIWDLNTKTVSHSFKAHNKSIQSLVMYQGQLLSGANDAIKMWDIENNYTCIKTLPNTKWFPNESSELLFRMVVRADRVMLCTTFAGLAEWQPETNTVRNFSETDEAVICGEYLDNKTIVTGDMDGHVVVHYIENNEIDEISYLRHGRRRVDAIAVLDNKHFAVASNDGTIYFLNTEDDADDKRRWHYQINAEVISLDYDGGDILRVVTANGKIRIIDFSKSYEEHPPKIFGVDNKPDTGPGVSR